MNFKECLSKGLIKRDATANERVQKSLEIGDRFLASAKKNIDIEEYEMAEIATYNAIFHSARSLLFNVGYTERSHACLIIALRTLYATDHRLIEIFNTFDKIRISRHNIQYGGTLVKRDEAEFVYEFAKTFFKLVKDHLEKKK